VQTVVDAWFPVPIDACTLEEFSAGNHRRDAEGGKQVVLDTSACATGLGSQM
jgi:hypothetical protein